VETVFGSLRKVFNWGFALVISSIIYAIVHFMESARTTESVAWFYRISNCCRACWGALPICRPLFRILNLTLAGMLLG